jgi:hypothetical protein
LRGEAGLLRVSGKEDGLTSFSTDVIVVPQHPHGGAMGYYNISLARNESHAKNLNGNWIEIIFNCKLQKSKV